MGALDGSSATGCCGGCVEVQDMLELTAVECNLEARCGGGAGGGGISGLCRGFCVRTGMTGEREGSDPEDRVFGGAIYDRMSMSIISTVVSWLCDVELSLFELALDLRRSSPLFAVAEELVTAPAVFFAPRCDTLPCTVLAVMVLQLILVSSRARAFAACLSIYSFLKYADMSVSRAAFLTRASHSEGSGAGLAEFLGCVSEAEPA